MSSLAAKGNLLMEDLSNSSLFSPREKSLDYVCPAEPTLGIKKTDSGARDSLFEICSKSGFVSPIKQHKPNPSRIPNPVVGQHKALASSDKRPQLGSKIPAPSAQHQTKGLGTRKRGLPTRVKNHRRRVNNPLRTSPVRQKSREGDPDIMAAKSELAEVHFVLKHQLQSESDLARAMNDTEDALKFMDQLQKKDSELHVLQGSLCRWILPLDTNTPVLGQAAALQAVLQEVPAEFQGKLSLHDLEYFVQSLNKTRNLIRMKILDDNDLKTAKAALVILRQFFEKLKSASGQRSLSPFDILIDMQMSATTLPGNSIIPKNLK